MQHVQIKAVSQEIPELNEHNLDLNSKMSDQKLTEERHNHNPEHISFPPHELI